MLLLSSRCFWEPAESLLKQPGILATTVGYMGNAAAKNKPPPSYDTVCFGNDYVEAVRVAYDDDILPYPQLLDLFFELQKPGNNRQYASVIFVEDSSNGKTTSNFKSGSSSSDDEQLAIQWKNESMQTKVKRSDNLPYSYVEIEPMQTSFFRAEEYHQRYWEKQRLRALVGVALIAGSSGAYDNVVPFSTSMNVVGLGNVDLDTVCNAAFLVGAGWMILERLVTNGYVRELKSGDFVKMLQ